MLGTILASRLSQLKASVDNAPPNQLFNFCACTHTHPPIHTRTHTQRLTHAPITHTHLHTHTLNQQYDLKPDVEPLFAVEVLLEHGKTKDHLNFVVGEVACVLLLSHAKLPGDRYLVEKEDGTSKCGV